MTGSRPASSKERNLHEYRVLGKKILFPDLSQYAANGRGRGELADGSLMTLTTNSSRIYSEDLAFSSALLVADLAVLILDMMPLMPVSLLMPLSTQPMKQKQFLFGWSPTWTKCK